MTREPETPPHSKASERGMLACLLTGAILSELKHAGLSADLFYDHRHRRLFEAIEAVSSEGGLPDVLSVGAVLARDLKFKDANLVLAEVMQDATSPANASYFLPYLLDATARRHLIELARSTIEHANDQAADPKVIAREVEESARRISLSDSVQGRWFQFHSPSECSSFDPPCGKILIGDCQVVRGAVTLIAGAPGVGKSRSGIALALSGATGKAWFSLDVHRKFKTAILQNENGMHRLKQDFAEIGVNGLNDYIRISEPPPFGMAFDRPEFRYALAKWFAGWKPDVVVFDPWNSAARDDGQRGYLDLLRLLQEVLPKGDDAPALVIVAHTRKPRTDEQRNGRSLMNVVAGSHVLVSVPRCIFVMQHGSDDPEDDRVVWTCAKNNDGQLGSRTAWYLRNGLFVPCSDFDWDGFDTPSKDGTPGVTKEHLDALFEHGKRRLLLKTAVAELETRTGCKKSACYQALKLDGRFRDHLSKDSDGLHCWKA